jgi:large subunit ribosomal protein L5
LKEKYYAEVGPAMIKEFGYKSIMSVARVKKVTLNMGLGEAVQNIKVLDSGVEELTMIAGQKAVVTKAKRSIGCMVTLRRDRMFDFLDKLFNVALARVRDFRGLSDKCFDGRANCTISIKEHIIFPEIDYDKVDRIKGLNITIVTTAKSDAEGLYLLKNLGMPFRG